MTSHGMASMVACLVFVAAVGAPAAQMRAQLERDTVYLGAQTLLIVEVADAPSSVWPVVEAPEGLTIGRYGSPAIAHDLLRNRVQRTYRFRVVPDRSGTFTIAGITLDAGGESLHGGPVTLAVVEAPLRFETSTIEPGRMLAGEAARLVVQFAGTPPGEGVRPVVPEVKGVTIRPAGGPRVEMRRRDGMPLVSYIYQVTSTTVGRHRIGGITLAGLRAEPVTLEVGSFVVVDTRTESSSLEVGSSGLLHVVTRGLPDAADLHLVTPAGIEARRNPRQVRGPPGTVVFSYDVTARQPGSYTLEAVALTDGQRGTFPEPVTLSVRQAGEPGILACRGIPRSDRTVVGEPFIVDYEVLFRGDLRAAGIDTSDAGFAQKDHVKVEPVNELSYPDWSGQPVNLRFGDGAIQVLLGSGEHNGQTEQMLRFALRITPLAAEELSLDGLRVVVQVLVQERQATGRTFFSVTRTEEYSCTPDTPAHRVTDPPGLSAPPGYNGAVGRSFTFVTQLDRTQATAMSPLTLTMKISGESVGASFKPPDLSAVPELVRDFEVSPSVGGGEVEGDTITFEQVVRPRSEQVTELPALPLVYYDHEERRYSTVYSLPIAVTVTPGSLAGAGQMQNTGSTGNAADDAPPVVQSGESTVNLGANFTTLDEVDHGPLLSAAGVLAILVAGLLVVVLVPVVQRLNERRRPMATVRRRRQEVLGRLDELQAGEGFHARLSGLVQDYLRLTFELPPGEVSPDALVRAGSERKVDPSLLEELKSLLADCDTGRFAAAALPDAERRASIERARHVLVQLHREVR
jgi:hypothetical protein